MQQIISLSLNHSFMFILEFVGIGKCTWQLKYVKWKCRQGIFGGQNADSGISFWWVQATE